MIYHYSNKSGICLLCVQLITNGHHQFHKYIKEHVPKIYNMYCGPTPMFHLGQAAPPAAPPAAAAAGGRPSERGRRAAAEQTSPSLGRTGRAACDQCRPRPPPPPRLDGRRASHRRRCFESGGRLGLLCRPRYRRHCRSGPAEQRAQPGRD